MINILTKHKDTTEAIGNGIEKIDSICLIASSYLKHGGVEEWIHEFIDVIDSKWRIYAYFWQSVNIEAVGLREKGRINLIFDPKFLTKFCDVTIRTAYFDVGVSIDFYINHGSMQSDWSKTFLEMNKKSKIISVSKDSLKYNWVLHAPVRDKGLVKVKNRKRCDIQFAFVGRFSPEKRQDRACDFVKKIENACLFIVSDQMHNSCHDKNIHFMGQDSNVYNEEITATIVSSDSEGGPIVAVESWLQNVPVIMSRTGLCLDYPDKFIIADWDNPNETLNKVIRFSSNHHNLREFALNKFNVKIFREFWLSKLQLDLQPCHYIKDHHGLSVKQIGRTIIVTCIKDCQFTIVFTSGNSVSTDFIGSCLVPMTADLNKVNYIKGFCTSAELLVTII